MIYQQQTADAVATEETITVYSLSLFSFSVEDVVITDVETEFLVAMTAVQ